MQRIWQYCLAGRRYKLPVVIIVLNNNGIYGGDRRGAQLREAAAAGARSGGFSDDPAPTAFVENARCGSALSDSIILSSPSSGFSSNAFSMNACVS